jgi:triosephosphate isomerase
MRHKIIAGNWKMNTLVHDGLSWLSDFNTLGACGAADAELILFPPFTHLFSMQDAASTQRIRLGAQNCASASSGAYTGEVSAEMIKATGASFILVGHSERRQYYGETESILQQKLQRVWENGLTPIYCVGETLEQREAGRARDIIASQLHGALGLWKGKLPGPLVLAYEPVWAIGTGKTATQEQAQEMHAYLRMEMQELFGKECSAQLHILYGGSVKPDNAKALFSSPDIDGGLIGGASLKPKDFWDILAGTEA